MEINTSNQLIIFNYTQGGYTAFFRIPYIDKYLDKIELGESNI